MSASIKWFPPSWLQIKTADKTIYIDTAYLGTYFTNYPKKIEFSRWPDPTAPRQCIKELGKDIKVIAPWEEITSGDIRIKAVDAYNTMEVSSTRKVHHKGYGVGYLITLEGKTIYHAGDTDFIPEMKEPGDMDAALLPIGGTFTMDAQEAVKAAITIKPAVVIPMHMKKADPQEFKKNVEARSNIKVVPLQIGEIYKLK
ncbi:MAG: hypothetical protein A7316_05300 [Candidatus Altiarchaeales archaeon WOR_SM1_86-2]|nr:MAG: hypothetical protein A7316_05300 [Candidatus Altiarchaeales archaeon WOR_SM1_86-2]